MKAANDLTLVSPPTTRLAGWGANVRADCVLVEPETPGELERPASTSAGTIARGLGRSYGDAALNGGGQVVGMRRLDRYLGFDDATGTLTCEAGVSLARIIEDFAPRGFFPMITPGTKFVTVGGCIANDIHGKAHHAQGSFATSVNAFTLPLLANGEVRRAQPRRKPRPLLGHLRRNGSDRHRAHRGAEAAPHRDDVLPPAVPSGSATSPRCWPPSTSTTAPSLTRWPRSTSWRGARDSGEAW